MFLHSISSQTDHLDGGKWPFSGGKIITWRGENDDWGGGSSAEGQKSPSFSAQLHISCQSEQIGFHGLWWCEDGLPESDSSTTLQAARPRTVPRIRASRLVLTNMLMLPTLRACYGSFLVITFPGLTVKSTVPSVCIITSSYLGSISILPSTAITPQMPGYVSTAQ